MKTLLLLFITLVLIIGAEANANLGRKVNIGASDEVATTSETRVNEDINKEINTVDEANIDEDDTNPSAGNYGHGGSSTDIYGHRHCPFPIDKPPNLCSKKVNEISRNCLHD
ncbi:hypothetical protein Acr_00g0062250 [Actinidia rufa]|uniref:Uncharacterized protein n=1 Tax=Actinidia rufa TaxID=165716 RepID=A0A7J0DQR6_9ERIC|nr:hypothetical protein Acr_00g0062250 [Actinidia rufa]